MNKTNCIILIPSLLTLLIVLIVFLRYLHRGLSGAYRIEIDEYRNLWGWEFTTKIYCGFKVVYRSVTEYAGKKYKDARKEIEEEARKLIKEFKQNGY